MGVQPGGITARSACGDLIDSTCRAAGLKPVILGGEPPPALIAGRPAGGVRTGGCMAGFSCTQSPLPVLAGRPLARSP